MIRWFFRRRPRVVITQLTMHPQEAKIASAHGFTEAEWLSFTDQERAHFRATYTKAPRYAA